MLEVFDLIVDEASSFCDIFGWCGFSIISFVLLDAFLMIEVISQWLVLDNIPRNIGFLIVIIHCLRIYSSHSGNLINIINPAHYIFVIVTQIQSFVFFT